MGSLAKELTKTETEQTLLMTSEHYKHLQVGDSAIHGKGLFAARAIPKGSYMGSYEGPVVEEDGMYVLWVTDEDGNESGHLGVNRLRFINHDKTPNAEFDGIDLYALRKIKPGEEITIDYGWDD